MLVQYKDKTRTRRFASHMEKPAHNEGAPKRLKKILKKHAGRSGGKITVRHQGGRNKRFFRVIDFARSKRDVPGVVEALEYDPNRTVNIALIKYEDGDRRYILGANGLNAGDSVIASDKADIRVGNALKIKNIPVGTMIHNVEIFPGKGGQIARSAGTSLSIQAKEGTFAHLKLPSGEVRMIPLDCYGTIGALGNEERKNMELGKAGRARHMGRRPGVRGVAMDPGSHPHGGGEARSGVGRKKPMTVYGRPAVGKTRQPKKHSNRYIVKRRQRK